MSEKVHQDVPSIKALITDVAMETLQENKSWSLDILLDTSDEAEAQANFLF